MKTDALYFKIYNETVVPAEYVKWALSALEKQCESPSLLILAALQQPSNPFETAAYFQRAEQELRLVRPSYAQSVAAYARHIAEQIVHHPTQAMDLAYEMYHLLQEEDDAAENWATWYELTERVDEVRYGDNPAQNKQQAVEQAIIEQAKRELE